MWKKGPAHLAHIDIGFSVSSTTVFGTKKFSIGVFQRRGSLANVTVIPI